MSYATDAALLLGRILFGGFFLYSGINHFANAAGVAAAAASQGVPFPMLAGLATGVLLLMGGACILLGVAPRAGLGALVVFLVGVTPIMHAFWAIDDPAARSLQLANFLRNVALLGAVLALSAIPVPWPMGLEAWWRGRHADAQRRARRSI